MATSQIQLEPKQRQRLARRAKKHGRSLSQEVSSAVDLCLSVPVDSEAELSALSREAGASADRSIARLDETIACRDRELKKDQEASVRRTRDALAAIKRIILIEERVAVLCKQATALMEVCKDLDRRLVRIEAKFELLRANGSAGTSLAA